ncbi:hypothetical protein OXPF_13630 [Oxobacter pfennigii]|uniref:Uncharacterized protein n=1 Tax=Oxobacter pfennigii TaxID=36849 RepID=A0A0P8WA92_9CLOT|nr:hypothetical protein [Oxobacter pfennigii]KPU44885.1 hypothetical protein OXPF_13630 [Oxobacter pfennigii]
MPKKVYEVNLSTEEIEQLQSITHKSGKHSAKTIMHANILLHTMIDLLSEKKITGS